MKFLPVNFLTGAFISEAYSMHQPQSVSYAHQLNTLQQQAKDLLTRVVDHLMCDFCALLLPIASTIVNC